MELYKADSGHEVGNWEQIRVGRRLQLGNVEVEAHDAGHVLGSVQFEIITRDENLVYASHLNFTDTLISKAAEVAPCDTLILEATFPTTTQVLPSREAVTAEIVKWGVESIREHRIPSYVTDSIGIAQELIRLFNTWTELTVAVHPKIARINQVYTSSGIGLDFVDAGTEEASALVAEGRCVVIVPRRFDVTHYGDFKVAYVTGWPSQAQKDAGKIFLLSDQADLGQLLNFVKEARPKTVLTFRGGGSKVLAELVSKRFSIVGRELTAEIRPSEKAPVGPPVDEVKAAACEDYILSIVRERNLTYEKGEIFARAINEGFKLSVIDEALKRLTQKNSLRYSDLTEGYSLS
jgi:putative mRNA 3-end processing factor